MAVPKILIVDDEPQNVMLLRLYLRQLGYDSVGVENAIVALEILDSSFDLVLCDVLMPEMNGFEMVQALRKRPDIQDIPVIMVTTLAEKADRLRAVEAGANDYITKPVDLLELRVRAASMLKVKAQQDEIRSFQLELSELVEARTLELRRALQELDQAHAEVIQRLSAAAEFKDEETGNHIVRMARYCALIAQRLGHNTRFVDLLLASSPMHDVGKIGIPDHILHKPGKLNAQEWEIMKTHTTAGARILESGTSEYIRMGATIALSHHEKWDGSGYPLGLSGGSIPLEGRICAVADVFDALTSKRPYKDAFPLDKALDIMRAGRGIHFDPRILDVFLDNLDQVLIIKDAMQE